ncbi:MAG: ABC transporter ATP-binding protein [Deltaproteobacteria bacterium]|nr:ABC transporter ATP-binding protein [Deltaproteobacteria bacterium]
MLELRALRKTYGAFEALAGVDLTVAQGQVFGVVGPNGAGKTTTLRLITGLLSPTSGSIRVCGIDALAAPLEAKLRIGFIGDRPFLYEKLTGAEFLRFVGGLFGMGAKAIRTEAARWLERFELASWAGEPIEAYSHGMRQRLLLCSALLHSPDLLVLDEPMVGLDPRGAARLKQVLRELADEHELAVLVSTHTLEMVEQTCDALAIIDRGRIVASGTLDEVRQAHRADGVRLEALFLQLTEPGQRSSDSPSATDAPVASEAPRGDKDR